MLILLLMNHGRCVCLLHEAHNVCVSGGCRGEKRKVEEESVPTGCVEPKEQPDSSNTRNLRNDMLFILLAVLPSFILAQCPYAYTALNGGTQCSQTTYCQALGGSGYECMNGQCCRINGLCNVDEIAVSSTCYKIRSEGGACVNSVQCQPNGVLTCRNGFCRRQNDYQNPVCQRSSLQVEREDGRVKNCMYSACSVGFGCEYSQQINQYICCGTYNANNDYNYGRIRMYPGTSMPLQCFRENQCLFDDTPNCVYSQRYNYKVCCSTYNC